MADVHLDHNVIDAAKCDELIRTYDEWGGFTGDVDRNGNPVVDLALVLQVAGPTLLRATLRSCWRLTGAAHDSTIHPETAVLTRLRDGQGHEAHADNARRSGADWVANHTPHRDFAGILYLNAVRGGLLKFSRADVGSVQPAPGTYVTFPCGPDYVHYVTPVDKGDRFTLAMWFTRTPNTAHPVLTEIVECVAGDRDDDS